MPTIVLKPQDPSFPVPLRLKLQYQESVKTCQANFPSSPEVQQTPGKLKEVAAIPNSLVQLMLTQDDPLASWQAGCLSTCTRRAPAQVTETRIFMW